LLEEIKMKEKKYYLFIIIALIYIAIIIEYFLIENKLISVSYGKDGGLIFIIFSICVLGSVFFIANSKFSLKFLSLSFILGFLSGLFSCYLTFKIFTLFAYILNGDNSGLNISLIWDMLTATTIMILFGLMLFKFQNSSSKKYE
jgi:hypothetical protein